MLSELGHEVVFAIDSRSEYTWHRPRGIIFTRDKSPDGDAIIATGFRSVPSTLESGIQKKFYYIRGLELWQAKEEKLLQAFGKLKCIVNSKWLWKYLKKKGIDSALVYPGIDESQFYSLGNKREDIVGGLCCSAKKFKETKKGKQVRQIGRLSGYPVRILNEDIKNANNTELRKWYNTIKVWFAPTELEGLHNPPIEAGLSGCALVCTDHPRSGMRDYAVHKETALVYPAGDLKVAVKYIRRLITDEEYRKSLNTAHVDHLRQKIGTRVDNMRKLTEILRRI